MVTLFLVVIGFASSEKRKNLQAVEVRGVCREDWVLVWWAWVSVCGWNVSRACGWVRGQTMVCA